MGNEAAWYPSKGEPLEVGPAEIPKPIEGELVIEVCIHYLKPS
jgi:hypothetical protein